MAIAYALRLLNLLAAMAPERWLYRLAERCADLALPLAERRRIRVRNNLTRVRPEWEPQRLDAGVRGVFRETACYYVDAAVVRRHSAAELLSRHLRIEGLEHLHDAMAQGKGAVLAGAHLGNPEVPVRALPALGVRVVALVEPLASRAQREALALHRSAPGVDFVVANAEGVRAALSALSEGAAVAILFDRDVQGGGQCLPFFGRQARFPVGAVDLAIRAGAPLLPVAITRERDLRFQVRFLPALEMLITGKRGLDVRTNTADLVRLFEPIIAEHCDQWRVFESPWAPCKDAPFVDPHDEAALSQGTEARH